MRKLAVVASVVVMMAGVGIAGAQEAQAAGQGAEGQAVKKQTVCPVMVGNAINKKLFTDYQGKRIYFCCNACPAMFKKDPLKYIKKLEAEGITLDKTPQTQTTNAPTADPHQGEKEHKTDEHSGNHH